MEKIKFVSNRIHLNDWVKQWIEYWYDQAHISSGIHIHVIYHQWTVFKKTRDIWTQPKEQLNRLIGKVGWHLDYK